MPLYRLAVHCNSGRAGAPQRQQSLDIRILAIFGRQRVCCSLLERGCLDARLLKSHRQLTISASAGRRSVNHGRPLGGNCRCAPIRRRRPHINCNSSRNSGGGHRRCGARRAGTTSRGAGDPVASYRNAPSLAAVHSARSKLPHKPCPECN